ncbi:MAG TPA: hypothetical protein VGD26_01915 [Chitinophagaceae bacterium]
MVLPVAGETGWADKLNNHINALSPAYGTGTGTNGLPGRKSTGRTDIAHVSNQLRFTYFEVIKPVTIVRVSADFFNIVGTGGLLRSAIYNALSPFDCNTLVGSFPDIAVANTGITSVSPSLALPVGMYFLVTHSDFQGTLTGVSTRARTYENIVLGSSTSFQNSTVVSTGTLASGAAWPASILLSLTTANYPTNVDHSSLVALSWNLT